MGLIERASTGLYNPHYTKEEKLISVVLHCLGAAQLTEFSHFALAMPVLTITCHECNDAILASPSFPMLDELHQNLEVVHVRFASKSVFFFQAEDGIRDHCVTGVQTCALPI